MTAERLEHYRYDAESGRLRQRIPDRAYDYDAGGRTTADGRLRYRYGAEGRLAEITRTATGQRQAVYRYNALGERARKLSTSVTYYHYDLEGRLLAETDAGGQTRAEYLYLGNEPLALSRSGQIYYYHNDHLGTPQKLTDGAGQVVWSARYRPFGEASIGVGYVTQNLRFPGQYYDEESGLHYNYQRYYDPSIGRYIKSDPIGIVPGASPTPMLPTKLGAYLKSLPIQDVLMRELNHAYAYVENNPLNLIDPLGLYGTTNCSYYQQRCEQLGGVYYCYLAPIVCENTPPGLWTNCVRQCLQEFDQRYCETDNCGDGSDVPCVMNIHQMCWQEYIGGGPPVTYP